MAAQPKGASVFVRIPSAALPCRALAPALALSLALVLSLVLALVPLAALAQEGPFGGFKHDSKAPIEITSDSLEVRQAEQVAVFSGDVVAGQGTLRLTADTVTVSYGGGQSEDGTGEIREMRARGNVFVSNGSETAQATEAQYDVAEGMLHMTGQVVLTQGDNAISGERLVIDLDEGTGRIEGSGQGRVKSVFTPSGN